MHIKDINVSKLINYEIERFIYVVRHILLMEIALTKMSSKGQVVIPIDMRKGIKEGEKLIIIKSGHQLIVKKASELNEKLKEDIEFARRTEEAWKRYERGEFISKPIKVFLKELKKW